MFDRAVVVRIPGFEMQRKQIFVICLALLAVGCLSAEELRKSNTTETTTNTPIANANVDYAGKEDAGRVREDYKLPNLSGASVKILSQQPAPEIVLLFDCHAAQEGCVGNEFVAELPLAANDTIGAYWKESIAYQFNDSIAKPKLTRVGYEHARDKYLSSFQALREGLKEVTIKTPKGERKISGVESDQIMSYLNRSAHSLVAESGYE